MNNLLSLKLSEALGNLRELVAETPEKSYLSLASKAVLEAGLQPNQDYVEAVLRAYFMLTPEQDRRLKQNRFWAWIEGKK